MTAEQTTAELTTRDVLQQVDRRLSLIEEDLRSLDDKVDDIHAKLDAKIDIRIEALDAKFDARFEALDAKFDARFGALDAKFDARFGALDAKFGARFGALDSKFDTLALATRQDIHAVKQDLFVVKQDLRALELRLKHDLTVRLGSMMVVGITLVATLVKLL